MISLNIIDTSPVLLVYLQAASGLFSNKKDAIYHTLTAEVKNILVVLEGNSANTLRRKLYLQLRKEIIALHKSVDITGH